MALQLNVNSYVELSEADAYMEDRIDSASWFDAADLVKEQALITATAIIDDNPWIGYAVSSSQDLAWPRKNAVYYDRRLGQQISFSESEIPNNVKKAVYEQALHLINNEDLLAGTTQTFESISIGPLSLSDSNGDVTRVPTKPKLVLSLIKDFLVRGSSGMGAMWWRAN